MKSNFVKCGILGWCIEIIWTAFHGIKSKNNKFIGYTSIIMFPIYGLASVIKPISLKLKENENAYNNQGDSLFNRNFYGRINYRKYS